MTRETKIGLLVGLAFIIVIGILLSDHLTSSNEPPQATLAVAGNNVRSGVTTPGAVTNPQISANVTPAPLAPRTTVPTQTDLAPKAQPVQPVQVAVGGPSIPETNTHTAAPTQDEPKTSEPQAQGPVIVADNRTTETTNTTALDSDPVITKAPPITMANEAQPQPHPTRTSSSDIAAALHDVAKQHGEDVVSIGGGTPASARQTPVATKQYVAVDGDSLSKIASKVLGANTKANREAIINLNASLKQNPDIVVVGKTYNVPGSAAGVVGTATMTPINPVVQAPAPAPTSTTNEYTVKEGDSLWKIATEQCGSANAIAAIKELNKDTLKGGDTVVINTKLKLPNKVASAN